MINGFMAGSMRFSNVFSISRCFWKTGGSAGRAKHLRFYQTVVAPGSRYDHRCHSAAAVIVHQLLQPGPKSSFQRSALQSWQLYCKSATRTYKSSSATMEKTAKGFERLPKSVVPINYDITIKPDLVALVFEGSECITLKVNIHCFILG